jgi:hypothetical protein
LINPETNQYLEFDIFIPSLNLAFEYHEQHHYIQAAYVNKPLEEIKERDQLKLDLANHLGITLIIIPCWWDRTAESLIATIKKIRPDAIELTTKAEPISDEPPANFFEKQLCNIEGIGAPITASFFKSADNVNPKGRYVFFNFFSLSWFLSF